MTNYVLDQKKNKKTTTTTTTTKTYLSFFIFIACFKEEELSVFKKLSSE